MGHKRMGDIQMKRIHTSQILFCVVVLAVAPVKSGLRAESKQSASDDSRRLPLRQPRTGLRKVGP